MSTRTIASQPIATPRSGRRPWRTGYSKAQVPRATSMTSSLSMMSFAAKVDEDVETADLAVVQELEAGSVPNDVLPAPVSSLFRQRDGLADERDVAAKL